MIAKWCDEISDPTPILIFRCIAGVMIRSKQCLSWNRIETRNHKLVGNADLIALSTVNWWFQESGPVDKLSFATVAIFKMHKRISPGQIATNLTDDIFKYIFLNENYRIPIQLTLKFVPRTPIDNTPSLVRVMAWRRTGDKPVPEPMTTQFIDAYMRH